VARDAFFEVSRQVPVVLPIVAPVVDLADEYLVHDADGD
jgi:hypothetical protein